jgi:hypothetical protein
MWTCGIAIATQQARPATQSKTISALGETPRLRGKPVLAASNILAIGCARRSAKMNGSVASAQNIPTPR